MGFVVYVVVVESSTNPIQETQAMNVQAFYAICNVIVFFCLLWAVILSVIHLNGRSKEANTMTSILMFLSTLTALLVFGMTHC
jgi:cell division protein FtsW (lipid II flippase)